MEEILYMYCNEVKLEKNFMEWDKEIYASSNLLWENNEKRS